MLKGSYNRCVKNRLEIPKNSENRTVGFFDSNCTFSYIYTVSQKNWATFIFTVTLANVGRFLKFFQCQNQKEMAHNKNEKFPTVA